jgi:uncharacterized protein
MTEREFLDAVFENPINREVVDRLPSLCTNDAWLVSGSLFQSVWNAITGRPPEYGIKDYDVFYFDPDPSWEAEDAIIQRAAQLFADLDRSVQVRNQSRVHLWYPEKFGAPYSPLRRTTEGIDRFLMVSAMVGVSNEGAGPIVYAPLGFADIEAMIIRPNRTANFQERTYYGKTTKWQKLWPELTVMPA